jgi:hypothetical protein
MSPLKGGNAMKVLNVVGLTLGLLFSLILLIGFIDAVLDGIEVVVYYFLLKFVWGFTKECGRDVARAAKRE